MNDEGHVANPAATSDSPVWDEPPASPGPLVAHERAERLAGAALWRAAGALLREHREARGWSQRDLARRAGVPLGVVAQYELGEKRRPAPADWQRVTAALGLDLARFLDRAVARAAGRLAREENQAETAAACLALYELARQAQRLAAAPTRDGDVG